MEIWEKDNVIWIEMEGSRKKEDKKEKRTRRKIGQKEKWERKIVQ